jgi:hypothetical protein
MSVTKKRTQTDDIILIDEEEDVRNHGESSRRTNISRIAQRILNKHAPPTGQARYLVKWQGCNDSEATWEAEDLIKEKYSELI